MNYFFIVLTSRYFHSNTNSKISQFSYLESNMKIILRKLVKSYVTWKNCTILYNYFENLIFYPINIIWIWRFHYIYSFENFWNRKYLHALEIDKLFEIQTLVVHIATAASKLLVQSAALEMSLREFMFPLTANWWRALPPK